MARYKRNYKFRSHTASAVTAQNQNTHKQISEKGKEGERDNRMIKQYNWI